VPLPARALTVRDAAKMRSEYESRYERQFGLRIADVPVEFLTWSVNVSTVAANLKKFKSSGKSKKATSNGKCVVFDPVLGKRQTIPSYRRNALAPGMRFPGPALVVEPQTTTLVPRGWRCSVTGAGHLFLENIK